MENLKITILVIILVVLTAVVSWFSFNEFYGKSPKLVSNLEITLENNTEIDEDSDLNISKFSVVNHSEVPVKYQVILDDNSKDSDGIKRGYLRYEVSLDDEVVASGNMGKIKDDILITDTIPANSTKRYSLKIDVNDTVNLEGKTYGFDLRVVPVMK